MHRSPRTCLLVLLLAGGAFADDHPQKIGTLAAIEALDPTLDRVSVRYRAGMFAKLVQRCPDLRNLTVEEHSDLPPDDVRELRKLTKLESIEIDGELGIGEDFFEALGQLETLKRAHLALG